MGASSASSSTPPAPQPVLRLQPPFIGLLALFVAFLATPLSHSLSVLPVRLLGREQAWMALWPIGALALVLLVVAVRSTRESTGTVLGYVSAMLMWTGWAAYSFKFNEWDLQMPMADLEGSKRPMNLLFIQGSIGICVVSMLYWILDKDTKCNAFRWIQRHVLRFDLGRPESGRARNFGRVTFVETIYVLWFCYGISLFLGDPRYLGYDHPVTWAVIAGLALWGGWLVVRLMRYTRIMQAIRYAIPTKAIFWIPFGEFFPRWGFYHEIWLEPWTYRWEILGVVAVFVALGLATLLIPQRKVVAAE